MSFFGKKKEEEAPKGPIGVINTGNRIDEIVANLVESAHDSEGRVRSSIIKSLVEIGKKQPNLVVSQCADFLKSPKVVKDHRVMLLNVIHQVSDLRRAEINARLIPGLISLGMAEMTADKDVVPDWQQAASSVLVSIGMRFPNEILEVLLSKFEVGVVPHYFIMKTLGDFIASNPIDTVPNLKRVLARILPVLASVKLDNMKWVFATGLGRFCEAILNYSANTKNEPKTENSLTVYSFSSDVFPAYEILYNNWLKSGEAKVRLATIQALGSICAVLSRDQLEAQLPKLIPALLTMYKKEKDLLPITQGLNVLLEVATKDGSRILDPHLLIVLQTIHQLSITIPDYSNSNLIKNYNELLRCFQTIGGVFSDNLVSFLLERMQQKDPKIRLGTIAIIRHLITHLVPQLNDKKGLLVTGIKPLIATETSYTIKKELAQVIIAMASQDYLTLEGGETLVEFIIRNASISDDEIDRYNKNKKKEDTGVSPQELRSICDNILNLTTTTIDSMQQVLWPYLFETIVPAHYGPGLGMICKCLSHIATIKRNAESEDYIIDFDRAVNLPKPQAIVVRLMVMLNTPHDRNSLGINVLAALKAIGPVLHPAVCDMWDSAIPKLQNYLEANAGPAWNQSVWEDLILRLLSETIKIANTDEWTIAMGKNLATQLELYNTNPDLKRIAFKHMGLILQKTAHKETIAAQLEVMLNAVDGNNALERQGCAQGFGYCAASHLDMTLEKVQNFAKAPPKKQASSGGLFSSIMGGSSKPETGEISPVLILCFGYIAAYASPQLITSRIEISILNHLKTVMAKPKLSLTYRETLVQTIDLIGKAMHVSHLKKEFQLKPRDELLTQIISYILYKEKGEVTDQLRLATINTVATLVNLDPPLANELETQVLEKVIHFYSLPGGSDPMVSQLQDGLNNMFATLLASKPNIECLTRLFKAVEPYVKASDSLQRERANSSILSLLKKFLEFKSKIPKEKREKKFAELGGCVAMLIPRCTDPQVNIRKLAIESIETCLLIDYYLKQQPADESMPDVLAPFNSLKEKIESDEQNEQFATVMEMSGLLAKLITEDELQFMLLNCLQGLNDSQSSSTSGTCVVLNGLIKARGKELQPKIGELVEGIVTALASITNDQTKNGTLHSLRSLAVHHQKLVVEKLLTFPVPHAAHVIKAFQIIAKDENLVMPLVRQLFDIINNSQLYDNVVDPKTKQAKLMPTQPPLSATCAVGEIMELEELEEIVSEHYAMFFGSLVLRIGTTNGMSTDAATQQITTTFKKFLTCAKDIQVEQALDNSPDGWKKFGAPDYYKVIITIAAAVSKARRSSMKPIFEFLFPFLRGNFPAQRIVSSTVLAEFVNQCKDSDLLQKLINCLLSILVDAQIKLHALRGLGNIVSVGIDEANKYAPTVLDALLSSIDDPNETIAMEAMNGLAKVFDIAAEQRMAPILVNICHRIKPAFDKENEEIRAAAFNLFGALHRFGEGSAKDAFYEQIHNNLTALIVHLNEDSNNVNNACKGALRKLAHLYRSKGLVELFEANIEVDRSLDYIEFLNEFSKVLIADFPEKINTYVMNCLDYYRSNWNPIKANAVAFTGHLLGNLPQEKRQSSYLNPTIVSKAMIGLLKEKSPEVRKTAAESMALLYDY